jgi:sec-independent protein translocase protein TatC
LAEVERRLTLGEHLEELRLAVRQGLIWLALCFAGCMCFQDPLVRLVTFPHRQAADSLAHSRLLDQLQESSPDHDPHQLEILQEELGTRRAQQRDLELALARQTTPDAQARLETLKGSLETLRQEQDAAKAKIQELVGSNEAESGAELALLTKQVHDLGQRLEATGRKLETLAPQTGPSSAGSSHQGTRGRTLQVLSYQEGFLNYLKIALISALIISAPLLGREAWRFVRTGLYPHEQRWVQVFAPLSLGPFFAGVAFGYLVLIPIALRYLAGYASADLVSVDIRLGDYLSLFLLLTLVTGVLFELPLVMTFIAATGIVSIEQMASFRRYFFLVALLVAALLTPPDVVTQVILGIPMVMLYEVGLISSRIMTARRQREAAGTSSNHTAPTSNEPTGESP